MIKTFMLIFAIAFAVFSADEIIIDENAMFSDPSSIVDSASVVNTAFVDTAQAERKSLSLSGEINALGQYSLNRSSFIDNSDTSSSSFLSGVQGNAFLDARLLNGIKGFVNLETQYAPAQNTTMVSIREIFLDANIARRIYFRAGKQVLQWGRCWFFTPTDLVNVERKTFVQKIGYREGTFGVKGHVPFGTVANIYTFLDLHEATKAEDIAGAGKFELLLGGVECGVAAWGRKHRNPVYGADISFSLAGIQFAGEGSLSKGGNLFRLNEKNSVLYIERENDLVGKAAFDITKSFSVQGIADRLSITGEFLYNGAGTSDNVFSDSRNYNYALPLSSIDPVTGISSNVGYGTKAYFFTANSLYTPNEYSRFYAALFSSFSRFIISDITASANAIINCDDGSALVSGAIAYTNLSNLSINLTLTGYLGHDKREYTIGNQGMDIRLGAGISF